MSGAQPDERPIDAGRLGQIPRERLQAALDRFDLGAFQGTDPAPGRGQGRTLFVRTSRGAWVMRGFPRPANAADREGEPERERFATELLHERSDLCVPWPYLVEPAPDLLGFAFAWMPRLPGISLLSDEGRRSLTADDPQLLALAAGRGLAALHGLGSPELTRWDATLGRVVPETRGHAARVAQEIDSRLEQARAMGSNVSDADVAWVRGIVADARPDLETPFPVTFVHRDFSLSNTLYARGPGGWQVAGVFDFSDWLFADPEEDLPRAFFAFARIRPIFGARFLEAYTRQRPLRPGFGQRLRVYALSERLDVWLFAHRRGRPEALGFRARAEPFVAQIPR